MRKHCSHFVSVLLLVFIFNIFYISPGNAEIIPDLTLDARTRLNNAAVLYLGNSHAIINNYQRSIDSTNPNVKPVLKNNRTLVPVRFISESWGAEVNWESRTGTVTINQTGKVIKLVIGSNTMLVNNVPIKLDVSTSIMNSRTFVPLRAITEAFGKYVFYDRGLIVISDTANIIDPDTEPLFVDEVIEWFNRPLNIYGQPGDLTVPQIAALEDSVVAILAYDESGKIISQGSGFAVGTGLFATNLHVINAAASYAIITADGEYCKAAGVVQYDQKLDLAILKTMQPMDIAPLKIGSSEMLVKGDKIVTIGTPEGLQNTVSDGIVSAFRTSEDGVELAQITAPITFGSSGGPLLNMWGYVVGVTSMGSENGSLNFAVAIDYLSPWLKDLNARPFENIAVIPNPNAPYKPYQNNEGIQTVSTEQIPLNFDVADAVIDPLRPVIYISDSGTQKLYAVNYQTKQISAITFDLIPGNITFANNEIFVALSKGKHNLYEDAGGAIAIINAETFTLTEQFESVDPYGIVVDRDGYIHISPGSNQHTYMKSYDRTTRTFSSSACAWVYSGYAIALHPVLNKIYAVSTSGFPMDHYYYNISQGKIISGTDSPYHGDFPLKKNFRISPDGNYLFNGSGVVFYPNLNYVTTLRSSFLDIAFNIEDHQFYTSIGNQLINVYNYDDFTLKSTYKITGSPIKLFYKDQQMIAISQLTAESSGRKIIEIFRLN